MPWILCFLVRFGEQRKEENISEEKRREEIERDRERERRDREIITGTIERDTGSSDRGCLFVRPRVFVCITRGSGDLVLVMQSPVW